MSEPYYSADHEENDVPGMHRVVARLVATYNLSPSDATEVQQIDYLCVYEYEYEGIIYTYRKRQRDHFSPIPEEIDLYFKKDPNKAGPIRKPSGKSSSSWRPFIIGGVIAAAILLCAIYNLVRAFMAEPQMLIPFVLCAAVISAWSVWKVRTSQSKDERLEVAMLHGRSVTAYRVKTRRAFDYGAKKWRYKGKYAYQYKGKKYKKTFMFSTTPPESLRLFFEKNPKDVFF